MCKGDVDDGFGGSVAEFVVLLSGVAIAPCEGAFHDPAFGQHLELMQLVAFVRREQTPSLFL